MEDFTVRKYIIGIVIIAIAFIYVIKLFFLQVADTTYKHSAENNSQRSVVVYPARGLIYDRNGELLVYNEAAYDLMIIPRQVKAFDTLDLCNTLEMGKEELIKAMKKAKSYSSYKPSVLIKQISSKNYGVLQEKLYKYPGFFVQSRTLRHYPRKIAAHILGYVGEVNDKTIKENSYYTSGDYIGISGIEKSYEDLLRGKKGVQKFLVDVHNRIKGSYEGGKHDTAAVVGNNLIVTIDANLQAYGEKLMEGKKGSIVAIDPGTGEILSMVSSPGYDPNLLVGRNRSVNYSKLESDSLIPLFNRATMSRYSPGSIFKAVQALIGMQEQVIVPNTGFACANTPVKCHGHASAMNIQEAIMHSCNPYFYRVFQRLIQRGIKKSIYEDSRIGLTKWRDHISTFGLGDRLDVDLPGVKRGNIPDTAYYDRWYGKNRWAFSMIYSLSIGQGEVETVPIQIANLAALIANRGYYITPHLVKSIEGRDSIDVKYRKKNYTSVNKKYYEPLIEGMAMVVSNPHGTANWGAFLDSIPICGKTGTVQNSHGEDHSGFFAFAPKDNPQIAIAVYVENAGFGGVWAAPIASLMIEKYLNGEIQDEKNIKREKRILEYKQF